MKYVFSAVIVICASFPSFAAGYSDYRTEGGIKAAAVLPAAQKNYVAEMIRLLNGKDFSFIIRKDARHWIGVGTEKGRPTVYIHDESAGYNCRVLINLKTGAMIVLKGVNYDNLKKQGDADMSAAIAVEYLRKVMNGGSIFAGNGAGKKKMASSVKKTPAPPPKKAVILAKSGEPISAGVKTDAKESAKPAAITEKKESAPHAESGAEDPLKKLKDGNLRFVKGTMRHPNQSGERVKETAKGQHPFAIVVSCSDSRVPPEVLFDQGVGDLFVVRTAGEVVQAVDIGSVEYAAEHLHAPLIVVIGHKRCGAVEAAIKGGHVPDNIREIAKLIAPAVERAKGMKGDLFDNAVRINAENVARAIEKSPVIEELLKEQKIRLVTAYYDIDDGTVSFGD
jgi:carbonic anhydrase